MSIVKNSKVHITDQKLHDRMLKDYVDEHWKDIDVEVDWEWSGPGMYRIHEHTEADIPCISLKWECL